MSKEDKHYRELSKLKDKQHELDTILEKEGYIRRKSISYPSGGVTECDTKTFASIIKILGREEVDRIIKDFNDALRKEVEAKKEEVDKEVSRYHVSVRSKPGDYPLFSKIGRVKNLKDMKLRVKNSQHGYSILSVLKAIGYDNKDNVRGNVFRIMAASAYLYTDSKGNISYGTDPHTYETYPGTPTTLDDLFEMM